MAALVVAGVGTDVGKTYVAAELIRELTYQGVDVNVLKPVVSGFDPDDWRDSDPGVLLEALGQAPTQDALEAISPWRFAAPVSPDLAARMEGRSLDGLAVIEFCRTRIASASLTIVEGAGGVASPVDETMTNLDVMAALGAPVVLVAGSYLGAISHALTAIWAIQARGLIVKAVVVSESAISAPFAETIAAIARLGRVGPLIAAPRGGATLVWRRTLAQAVLA
jgi:dethiobiotin synthetase